MDALQFIVKWRASRNYLGLPSVGIHVSWDQIPLDSRIEQLVGQNAWDRLYDFTPPWFQEPKTFHRLISTSDPDYLAIVQEETNNGKLELYRNDGLRNPFFCAFANHDGSFGILGDGNHRFVDCTYLIDQQARDFASDLSRCTLDVIYVANFDRVLSPVNIWPSRFTPPHPA